MKRALIGHRGVGKTALLRRHQSYFPDIVHFDLDKEIEKHVGMSVTDFFSQKGEAEFRKAEAEVFKNIKQRESFVIALGGGFDVDQIPESIEIVYVSRRTDSDSRIFLNRPRLNPDITPLDEYRTRYEQREPLFRKKAHWIYHLSEGVDEPNEIEKQIFQRRFQRDKAYLTLTPQSQECLNFFNKIELRTDLFADSEIDQILKSQKEFIVSYRRPTSEFKYLAGKIDWALELGSVPTELQNKAEKLIVSIHEGTLAEGIIQLLPYQGFHLKLCPVVHTWTELIQGHRWQQQDPMNRSFLPRTPAGEKSWWRWFRLLTLSQQKINFIQGVQDIDDQPSLFEVLNAPLKTFGAVLGYPVHHSRTPTEQSPHMNVSVLAIPIQPTDFDLAMFFLTELGLRFAAVTSPLKECAKVYCQSSTNRNSLVLVGGEWIGTSTDEFGFEKLKAQIPSNLSAIAIWGGGGVLESIQLPSTVPYSAQTGKPRESYQEINPQVVIWAAPRRPGIQFPSDSWAPQVVVDLNYAENSMGLEYAQKKSISYISGLEMFKAQAQMQREFWKKYLR